MANIFICISTILAFISPLVYAKAILKGEARPHRTTRLVLLIITSLSTISLYCQGNTVAIWLAGVSTVQSIIVFILSIKYGMGGWAKVDIAALIIALAGIMLWQVTNNPVIALYFAIGADFTGMVPAIIKTYKFPHTEIVMFFLLDVFAAIFNLFAMKQWTIEEIAYPFYIMAINLVMVILIIRPKLEKRLFN
jgi:hypothetical protein